MDTGQNEHNLRQTTSFHDRRVNSSTFLIVEDDEFREQPHVYVKVYPNYLLVNDTGCNAPLDKHSSPISLREYLETRPLASKGNECLNPHGRKRYVIICSHCHFDHILGIPPFLSANPIIAASDANKDFILQDLPTTSLCKYMDLPTPQYTVSHWASHMSTLSVSGTPLRVQFLHIPGHTPDSLAWYDIEEHYLYVGDTFYGMIRSESIPGLPDQQGAIIFPEEGGNWIQFMSSLDMLASFLSHENERLKAEHQEGDTGPVTRVKVCSGHTTFGEDAEQMVLEVQTLFKRIIRGEVPPLSSEKRRGIINDYWLDTGSKNPKFSVLAPRHLCEEARKHFDLVAESA
ncbi:MAG: hypothetical protein M1820_010638 [Bogoriella megaspora]|nr:MAG: hypothetical protein M1820_010638 [Bogoriella megaspora]